MVSMQFPCLDELGLWIRLTLGNIFGGCGSRLQGMNEAAQPVGLGEVEGCCAGIWHDLGRLGCGSRMKGALFRGASQMERGLVVAVGSSGGRKFLEGPCASDSGFIPGSHRSSEVSFA